MALALVSSGGPAGHKAGAAGAGAAAPCSHSQSEQKLINAVSGAPHKDQSVLPLLTPCTAICECRVRDSDSGVDNTQGGPFCDTNSHLRAGAVLNT